MEGKSKQLEIFIEEKSNMNLEIENLKALILKFEGRISELEEFLASRDSEIGELKNQIEDLNGEKSIILKKSQNVNPL